MRPPDVLAGAELVCFDCDGVIWVGNEPVEGAVDTLRALRRSGAKLTFVSNNSYLSVADFEVRSRRRACLRRPTPVGGASDPRACAAGEVRPPRLRRVRPRRRDVERRRRHRRVLRKDRG